MNEEKKKELAHNLNDKSIEDAQKYISNLKKEYEIETIQEILKITDYDIVKQTNDNELIDSNEILYESLKNKENKLRHYFAQNKDNPEIQNPYKMLIPIFDHIDEFRFRKLDSFEKNIPTALDRSLPKYLSPTVTGEYSIVESMNQFRKQFDIITSRLFEDFDWSHVMVAGGSVLASLSKLNLSSSNSRKEIRKAMNDSVFPHGDIDLFIYGVNTESEANAVVKRISYHMQDKSPQGKIILVRTAQAVTISLAYPFRHIQIILRMYKSPAEVLLGFDIDACTVAYDGDRVWATPRAQRALNLRMNLVDLNRRSLSYEHRLNKYSKRGFKVGVPGLDRSKVNPVVLDQRFPLRRNGLAKLLYFETNSNYTPVRSTSDKLFGIWSSKSWPQDVNVDVSNQALMAATDYHAGFVPWGPRWSLDRLDSLFAMRSTAFRSYEINHLPFDTMVYATNPEEIIYDDMEFESFLMQIDQEDLDPDEITSDVVEAQLSQFHDTGVLQPIAPGFMTWIKSDPGRQAIGSFHPLPPEDWFTQAYTPTEEFPTSLVTLHDSNWGNKVWPHQKGLIVCKDEWSSAYIIESKTANYPGMSCGGLPINGVLPEEVPKHDESWTVTHYNFDYNTFEKTEQ